MATTPSAPSVPAMTPAEAADHPRALGLTRVDEVEVGDVVYFVRQQVHAHVHPAGEHLTTLPERGAARRPDRVDLLWLDGYQPCGRYRGLRLADLDALAAAGHVRLVEAGVTDPYDRWALAPTGDNTEYDPVTPAPRLPTSQLTFDRCRSRTRTNGFLEHPVVNRLGVKPRGLSVDSRSNPIGQACSRRSRSTSLT